MKRSSWKVLCVVGMICVATLWSGIRATDAADILFLGANADPTFGDDGAVFDYLTDVLEHDVTYLAAAASTTADGEEVDLIILSSTPGSGDIRGKFQALSTPILNWEEAIMDGNTSAGNTAPAGQFAMGQGAENGSAAPGTQIQILAPDHPLAGGLRGTIEFSNIPIQNPYMTGQLGAGVLPIAAFPEPLNLELTPSGTGMHIGSHNNGSSGFVGLLDEVAVWDRALTFQVDANQNLTGGEIHTIYSQGIRAVDDANPGPIGYWAFDSDSDDSLAVDNSDNGNDALVDGGAFLESDMLIPNVGGDSYIFTDGTGTINADLIERPGGQLAYSFWFNPDSAVYGATFDAAEDPRVDFIYGNGVGGTVRPHLSANRDAGGGNKRPIGLYVNAGADLATPIEAATDAFTSDEWHHIVINWDGQVGTVFVDGKLDNEVLLGSPDQFTITAVEAGGALNDGTMAAGPRVNFPVADSGFAELTDDGLTLFSAAIDWLLGGGTTPLLGDYNGNQQLDTGDLDLQAAAIAGGQNPTEFDLNGDGVVDAEGDRAMWLHDLKVTWVGDADLDGLFDTQDFVTVFVAGKYETGETANWDEGDWNADLLFDTGDFVAAFVDGGYEIGAYPGAVQAVPEPSSLALLAIALLGLAGMRKRN